MFVYNNCRYDSRVLKEAKTLSDSGHDVRIIAILTDDTKPYEERDGFRIIRVNRDPIHYRLLRAAKQRPSILLTIAWVQQPLTLAYRRTKRFLRPAYRRARRFLRPAYRRARRFLRPAYRRARRFLRPAYRRARRFLRPAYRRARRFLRPAYRRARRPLNMVFRRFKRPFRLAYRNVQRTIYSRLRKFLLTFHRPLSFIDYYYRSWQAIKNEPADVYHSHDLTTLPIGFIAKRRANGKLVYDSHEIFTELIYLQPQERQIFRLLERYLIHRADEVITVNELASKELSNKYGIVSPNVVNNCPPFVHIVEEHTTNSLRQRLGLADKVPIILYVGGFSPGRNLHNLILSVPYLDKGMLAFLGWGPLEDELKALVKKKKLHDRVFFTQPVQPNEVIRYIASASVGTVIHTCLSLNHYYATPNKLFEYIGAGLPVVSSNFPALSSVVEGYNLGKTCNPEDPRDIAAAINWILSDKERYSELRKNARKAAKVFNWENEAEKLRDIYERLKNSSHVPAG
jgi:glycosyltransferase involved in cell wall biosynthesis